LLTAPSKEKYPRAPGPNTRCFIYQ
jgi:hypothetical protein